jgi:AcrR family transcriptional regulator
VDRETYHHKDLKQQLIKNGLILLNNEGFQGFSLRKVATMCGVSNNAPYKHFKDKDELINEILNEVWTKFRLALQESTELHTDDPKLQIVGMGKSYVRFMVENPEYLKLIFLSDYTSSILIENGVFSKCEDNSFSVFKDCAGRYFKSINLEQELYMPKTMAMWSLVHGIAVLIAKKAINYKGDYLELVEKMIITSLL